MRAIVLPFSFLRCFASSSLSFHCGVGGVCVCVLLLAPQESNVSRDVVRWHALLLHCWASSSPPSIESLLGNSNLVRGGLSLEEECTGRAPHSCATCVCVCVSGCVGFRFVSFVTLHVTAALFVFFGSIGPLMGDLPVL